jgi:hypothetical protein
MVSRTKRKSRDVRPRTPRLRPVEEANGHGRPVRPPSPPKPCAPGVCPCAGRNRQRTEIPREGETIRAGDPDDRVLANEYAGEETPGGSATTPDQNEVDAVGRAYGLQEEDAGSLRCASEILTRRDRRRSELIPPRRPV